MSWYGGRKSACSVAAWVLTAMVCVTMTGVSSAQAATVEAENAIASTKSAEVSGEVDPQGVATLCHVQYVTAEALAQQGWAAAETVPCSPEAVGSGASAVAVGALLSGLALDGVYEYRFAVESGGVTVFGAAETFATFGVGAFSFEPVDSLDQPYGQAGGHPYELVTKIVMHTSYLANGEGNADGELRDVRLSLPPGLVGNPQSVPQCPQQLEEAERCPRDAQIGTIGVRLVGDARKGASEAEEEPSGEPLFNLVPPEGVTARFGAVVNAKASAFIDAGVRSGSDYGVNADSLNITSFAQPARVVVKLWGEPASSAHNAERFCLGVSGLYEKGCPYQGEGKPFLREPTSCTGTKTVTGTVDSYQEPDELVPMRAQLPAMVGCENVPFAPGIGVTTAAAGQSGATQTADSPTGLTVQVSVPQIEEAKTIATSDLKDAAITLPEGLTVNPSSADGLGVCSEQQVGFEHFAELEPEAEPGVKTGEFTAEPANCPDESKLGNVEIKTPLLAETLRGAMYLATPHQNPFGSLLAVYLTVDDPARGVLVKLPGRIETDAGTGQITAVFDQNPQLPFESLKVSLLGGERSPLTTPTVCGDYAAHGVLTSWSGGSPVTPASAPFEIDQEPSGGSCPSSEAQAPNAPTFEAGATNTDAAAYSSFVLNLRREDGSQHFQSLDITLPPGLLGNVTHVPQCPQGDIEAAEALSHEGQGATEQAQPSCPSDAELGTVHVGAGSGAPLYVTGHVYFAGPYEGAPFSFVIITPAIAGPFDLGTVVVRAGLYIDPRTAQVTVKSRFPTILDGIPLDIRHVGVEITRPQFILNPTNCQTMAVTGQSVSTAERSTSLSDRFEVGGCRQLHFNPYFKASAQAKVSRRYGASLKVVIAPNPGEANLRKVDVQLPKLLPSREETLKMACTSQQFAANPAACPSASKVGTAIVHTPILKAALVGPAVLVSRGGAGFPNLDLVLQATEDGGLVTIVAEGETLIKNGITYSRFEAIPDAPLSRMELNLPEGRYAILGAPDANGNLCGKPLVMPTTLVGQNGGQVEHSNEIEVEGCSKTLGVRAHRVKKRTLTVQLYVPAAGKVTVSGKGLRTATRSLGGTRIVTLKVLEKRAHKLKTVVHVTFSPKAGTGGSRQVKSFSVRF